MIFFSFPYSSHLLVNEVGIHFGQGKVTCDDFHEQVESLVSIGTNPATTVLEELIPSNDIYIPVMSSHKVLGH